MFDPEFYVFGPKLPGERLKLAELPPWVGVANRHEKHRIRPYDKGDLLDRLYSSHGMKAADYPTLTSDALTETPVPARWLLFCAHPLREAENTLPPATRPYLTDYTFADIPTDWPAVPLAVEGADAEAVISAAEQFALANRCAEAADATAIQLTRHAGLALRAWVEGVTKFGPASFLDEEKYFIPIPVAIVRVVD